jgi:hypothetical protein
MKFTFTEDKLTLGDLLQIEDGRTTRQTAVFLAKFVTDESGAPVDPKAAWAHVCGLTVPQSREAMKQFWAMVTDLRGGAINPTSAAS